MAGPASYILLVYPIPPFLSELYLVSPLFPILNLLDIHLNFIIPQSFDALAHEFDLRHARIFHPFFIGSSLLLIRFFVSERIPKWETPSLPICDSWCQKCATQRCCTRGTHEYHLCMQCERRGVVFLAPAGGEDPWAANDD